jgi:hypothetical protein
MALDDLIFIHSCIKMFTTNTKTLKYAVLDNIRGPVTTVLSTVVICILPIAKDGRIWPSNRK